jgi:hypothetical protein
VRLFPKRQCDRTLGAGPAGAAMELALTRFRVLRPGALGGGGAAEGPRVVGLAEAVANADGLASWLGAGMLTQGGQGVRPAPWPRDLTAFQPTSH